jgi:hypothetical protein
MKRKKAKKKCHCRKTPKLENMMLKTLRAQSKKIEKAIEKKTGRLGIVRR